MRLKVDAWPLSKLRPNLRKLRKLNRKLNRNIKKSFLRRSLNKRDFSPRKESKRGSRLSKRRCKRS